jgi:pyruvate kinase
MEHSRAQIIATIGPASKNPAILKKMIEHQMDAVRLNFSHGTYKEHAKYIKTIKEVAKKTNRRIPIIQDLSGPREKTAKGHRLAKKIKKIITEKDKKDLKFGLEQNIDYVAMSYVVSAKNIIELRSLMKKYGRIKPIIAKIERKEAIKNIDEIIKISDAIMVARGDLGQEMPIEKVPFIQHLIINKCKTVKKPVITATQMLFSMMENEMPTRAEVSDVAHAILDGSDAVMLSEETAIGKYPIEAVAVMERIVLESEKHLTEAKFNLLT